MLKQPMVPLLTPGEEREILSTLRQACACIASVGFTEWVPSSYLAAVSQGTTPLAGHCSLVAATVWHILGGWLAQGRVRYPSGFTSPHTWNVTANKTVVDLTSDQFPGGNGFDPPPSVMEIAYIRPDLQGLLLTPYGDDLWPKWVEGLHRHPAMIAIYRKHPLLPVLCAR
jgi:hypothetical protein